MFDVVRDGFQCLTIPRSGRYRFEVIGASSRGDEPGARIIGVVRLEKGEKITVALGQRGNSGGCGNGGTFVVGENGTSNPQPLFVAGGAGYADIKAYLCHVHDFGKASLSQTASKNNKIGSSGVQQYIDYNRNNSDSEIDNSDTDSDNDSDDENESGMENDIFCGGAGFLEGPVTGELRKDSVAPKSYKDGLIGGKGFGVYGDLMEGGFGGGGACYYRNDHAYFGAGGGYTGGGTQINDDRCDGGGGGSFSIDEGAKFDHVQKDYGKCTITYLA